MMRGDGFVEVPRAPMGAGVLVILRGRGAEPSSSRKSSMGRSTTRHSGCVSEAGAQGIGELGNHHFRG